MAALRKITFNGQAFGVALKEVNVSLDYSNVDHQTECQFNYLLNNCNLLNQICRDVLGVQISTSGIFAAPVIKAHYTKALSLSL